MKYLIAIVVILLLVIGITTYESPGEQQAPRTDVTLREDEEITEEFIHRWLTNDNGTTATYIYNTGRVDEDLVQGRETLAETIGLWMIHSIREDDQELFNETFEEFEKLFLEEDGFVNWKLNEEGESEVVTNALIDDIRIMDGLLQAYDKWEDERYLEAATDISEYLTEYNINNGIYVDFYDRKYNVKSKNLTLPYIYIRAMDNIVDHGLLDAETVENTANVLIEAPIDNGFYPLSYNVEEDIYYFDDDINMINQAFIAYHSSQSGERSEELLTFIKEEMANRGLVYGMYNRETKEPAAKYESPAVYGYLILYALEIGEEDLAQALYERVKTEQVQDSDSEYYGGYAITSGNTHIFDNLVPMMAEQRIQNSQ